MTTTRIQYVGMVETKPAAELERGDVTMWNGGVFYTVAGVERVSKRFLAVRLVSWKDGSEHTRKMRDDRNQAISETAGRGSLGKAYSYDLATRLTYFQAHFAAAQ